MLASDTPATDRAEAPKTPATYVIQGGHPLRGTVAVAGAKNAIGKQLVASLLTNEPSTFTNVPRITEIDAILGMLEELGTQHRWIDEHTLWIHTPEITSTGISQRYAGFNRIPILLLGPMLHRMGSATVPEVGGCRIGPRPIDFHIEGFRLMGARVDMEADRYVARCDGLEGANVTLPFPSVGATENLLMAASLARGKTVIHNAAMEPEIIDTILLLQKMGALIQVDVDRRITIEGVAKLHGTSHHTVTDRIEVASFAAAAVATNGEVHVKHARQETMITFLNALKRAGGAFRVMEDGITFFRESSALQPVHLETDVHPGFGTDWQQPFVVMLTQAPGVSVIHETVYEDRFGYTQQLVELGADIELSRSCLGSKGCRLADAGHWHSCIVRGPSRLRGGAIAIPDLRAGFAYLIAGLIAEGETCVSGISYIDRGYADVPNKLRNLGAQIRTT